MRIYVVMRIEEDGDKHLFATPDGLEVYKYIEDVYDEFYDERRINHIDDIYKLEETQIITIRINNDNIYVSLSDIGEH